MKIHEYQAKSILAKYGVPVPRGEVVETAADAAQAASRLGGGVSVVKAQIHAGGRAIGCFDASNARPSVDPPRRFRG